MGNDGDHNGVHSGQHGDRGSQGFSMTGDGLDALRVAQVLAADAAGRRWRGSGYRVTVHTVLTAAHVVGDASSIRARFITERGVAVETSADTVWVSPALDIAVLRISVIPSTHEELALDVPPVAFGRITGPTHCETVGFPRFKLRAGGARAHAAGAAVYRDTHHARGVATPLSNLRQRTLEITVGPPERENGRSPWEGMSGAPVWAADCVIAVVSEHHLAEGPGTLTASRVDRWYEKLTSDQLAGLGILIGLPVEPDLLVAIDPATVTAPASAPIAELPRDAAGFTGREEQLDQLTRNVEAATKNGRVLPVHAVDGMAGVGKTAFAVHAAHTLASRFPDGQLYLNLRAHAPGMPALTPGEALATLLAATGSVPQQIPESVSERAAAWRSRTAGKRLLMLLDDAENSSQIRRFSRRPRGPWCW